MKLKSQAICMEQIEFNFRVSTVYIYRTILIDKQHCKMKDVNRHDHPCQLAIQLMMMMLMILMVVMILRVVMIPAQQQNNEDQTGETVNIKPVCISLHLSKYVMVTE